MLHTFSLARCLFQYLLTLHHSNGSPATILYCDTTYEDVSTQGNIVNFNLLRPNGEYVGFIEASIIGLVSGPMDLLKCCYPVHVVGAKLHLQYVPFEPVSS